MFGIKNDIERNRESEVSKNVHRFILKIWNDLYDLQSKSRLNNLRIRFSTYGNIKYGYFTIQIDSKEFKKNLTFNIFEVNPYDVLNTVSRYV